MVRNGFVFNTKTIHSHNPTGVPSEYWHRHKIESPEWRRHAWFFIPLFLWNLHSIILQLLNLHLGMLKLNFNQHNFLILKPKTPWMNFIFQLKQICLEADIKAWDIEQVRQITFIKMWNFFIILWTISSKILTHFTGCRSI